MKRMDELDLAYRSGHRAGEAEGIEWVAGLLWDLGELGPAPEPMRSCLSVLVFKLRERVAELVRVGLTAPRMKRSTCNWDRVREIATEVKRTVRHGSK